MVAYDRKLIDFREKNLDKKMFFLVVMILSEMLYYSIREKQTFGCILSYMRLSYPEALMFHKHNTLGVVLNCSFYCLYLYKENMIYLFFLSLYSHGGASW